MSGHATAVRGIPGSWTHPFVAYCLTCRWVCSGHPPGVRERAKEHERTGR